MLFDYEKYVKQSPYYSNIENTPQYKRLQKEREYQQKVSAVLGGISSALNFIPGIGSLVGAGVGMIGKSVQATGANAANKEAEKVKKDFEAQLPEGVENTSATSIGTQAEENTFPQDFGTFMKALMNYKPKGPVNQETPIQPSGPIQDYTPSPIEQGVNEPMTAGIFDMQGGEGMLSMFADGGIMDTDEAPVIVEGGSPGVDTVALVDSKSGKDTGLRLDNGEMVVVSRDNVEALQKAVADGDMFTVFSIMQDQMQQKPQDGNMVEGTGPFDIQAEIERTNKLRKEEFERKKKESEDATEWVFKRDAKKKYDTLYEKIQALDRVNTGLDYSRKYGLNSGKVTPQGVTIEKGGFAEPGLGTDPEYLRERATMLNELQILEKQMNLGTKWNAKPAATAPAPAPKKAATGAGTGAAAKAAAQPAKPKDIVETLKMKEVPLVPSQSVESYGQTMDLTQKEYEQPAPSSPPSFMDYLGAAKEKLPPLQDIAGYGYDLSRFITGLKAAETELPTFSKPARFEDFMDRLEQQSYRGLSAPEMTALQTGADRAYAYDVANVYNLSGGNAGAALGNLGRAAAGRYRQDLTIAAMDRAARDRNLQLYGSYLPMDVNLDRTIFTDAFTNAMRTKQAGAQAMQAGYTNAMERALTNQFYGRGSQNQLLLDEQLALMKENKELAQAQKDYWKNRMNK